MIAALAPKGVNGVRDLERFVGNIFCKQVGKHHAATAVTAQVYDEVPDAFVFYFPERLPEKFPQPGAAGKTADLDKGSLRGSIDTKAPCRPHRYRRRIPP